MTEADPSPVEMDRSRLRVAAAQPSFPGRDLYDAGTSLHLAMGMFDGVHRGHQVVVGEAIREADGREGELSGVLTFDPHPSCVLYPERATPLIYPLEQRLECLLALGVDRVLVQPFDRGFAAREASAFLAWLKALLPGLKSLHVGENFRFGAGRAGTVETLMETAVPLGIRVNAHSRFEDSGFPVSSSRIREQLGLGRVSEVKRMLGRPYGAVGRVVSGQGLGRKLGFPTLNIDWQPGAPLKFGVYGVDLIEASDRRTYRGIANFGIRPTVADSPEPVLEVHLLEAGVHEGPLTHVRVEFLEFLRPEKVFKDRCSLQKQIAADVEYVRKVLGDPS